MNATIVAAFILGFAGSLHCLGMCGPLLAGIHAARWKSGHISKALLYHGGRIMVYGMMGALAGLAGGAMVMMGWQQWLAIAAGSLLLIYLVVPKKYLIKIPVYSYVRSFFSKWLQRKTIWADFLLGVLNGLLPCGLVYTALTAALLTGNTFSGISFMLIFGLGTLPAMLVASQLFTWLKKRLHIKSLKPVQYALVIVSFLLVLRGANLGIPLVSPAVKAGTDQVDCCSHGAHCH
jgi:uncharacterized protein